MQSDEKRKAGYPSIDEVTSIGVTRNIGLLNFVILKLYR